MSAFPEPPRLDGLGLNEKVRQVLQRWMSDLRRWVQSGGGGSALEVKDEGVSLDTAVTSLDFTGTGVTATNVGHAITVNVPGATGSALTVKDEGSNLDTAVTSVDFVGAGVTATAVGHAITVTIPSGTMTVKDEGVSKSTTVTTLDFVGANVTASGAGATETITVAGVQSVASADSSVTVTNGTTTADLSVNVYPPSPVEPNHSLRVISSFDYFVSGFSAGVGCSQSTVGTGGFNAPSRGQSYTDPMTASRRCNLVSSAAINSSAGVILNSGVLVYRGNATWGGGFEFFWAFGCEALNADSRLCLGCVSTNSILGVGNIEPSAAASFGAGGGLYVAFDSTDANIQIMGNTSNAVPATKTSTGISRPTNADWMKVWIWCDANASGLSVRVEKWTTAGTSVYTNTFTSNIPGATQSVQPTLGLGTGPTTATAVRLALQKINAAIFKP
jgi:hypothetical protein